MNLVEYFFSYKLEQPGFCFVRKYDKIYVANRFKYNPRKIAIIGGETTELQPGRIDLMGHRRIFEKPMNWLEYQKELEKMQEMKNKIQNGEIIF